MKLSKRQALEETRAMWQWLADNAKDGGGDEDEKNGYFEAHPRIKKIPYYTCYLCEWAINNRICQWGVSYKPHMKCLVKWSEEGGESPCCNDDSPYHMWYNEEYWLTTAEKRKYALQIVQLCNNALQELS